MENGHPQQAAPSSLVNSAVRALARILNSAAALRVAEVLDHRSENRMTEFGMLAQAFEFVKINAIVGDYLEFGVWRGKTFGYARTMAKRYRISDIKFRAFDSFAGLPPTTENTYQVWTVGQFACSREEFEAILRSKGFVPGEYVLIDGFYRDSLNEELVESMKRENVRAAIIYIDCDLYESTRDVLNFIKHFVQDGTIICFDDYYNYRGRADMGEQRALAEFLATQSHVSCRPYMAYSPLGMSFVCEIR